MDEFTSIALWILITYLAINSAIVWFDSTTLFNDMGVTTGITGNTNFNEADMNSFRFNVFGADCSTISAVDLVNTTACGLGQVYNGGVKLTNNLWNFLTAWVNLFDVIFTPLGDIGDLFKGILIPFFGLVEFVAIFIIALRILGVIRGGS